MTGQDEHDDGLAPELVRAAAALRAAGRPAAPSVELSTRVLALPRAQRLVAEVPPGATPLRRPRRALAAAWAAAGALAAVAGVLAVLLVTRGHGDGARATARLAFTPNTAAGARSSGSAVLEVLPDGSRRVRLSLAGLAPVQGGFYQLWISRDPDHRIAIGAFRPGSDGTVTADVRIPDLPPNWRALWLTREPDDGNPAWTQDWIVKGKFAT